MRVLGLTGGIACGKSTVARRFREAWDITVVDADQAARTVVEPGTPALVALVRAFGSDILGPDGTLDRAAMRTRIIHDADARKTLEAITHPAILGAVASSLSTAAAAGASVGMVEAALLVETGGYKRYDGLVVVTCQASTQLHRVMARDGVDEAAARAIIATQLPLSDKEAVADWVIRNDGDLQALYEQVDALAQELIAGAGSADQ